MQRVCVTNRLIAGDDFLKKLDDVAKTGVDRIILREKDLEEEKYLQLAKEVKLICENNEVTLYINSFAEVAKELGVRRIHMPLFMVKDWSNEKWKEFEEVGVSIHSCEEAIWAEKAGASYVIAGHIFETDCKKGLMGRGIQFLREVCDSVSIPVFAIGGIDDTNEMDCINAGAAGICKMSSYMK